MLSTNLLPPEQQTALLYERAGRVIRFFALALVLLFFMHTILLLPSYLPQYFIKNELVRLLALEKEASELFKTQQVGKDTNEIAAELLRIRAHFADSGRASSLLAAFFRFAEVGVNLSTVQVASDGTIFLSGKASTRRNLLAFEKELRESGYFIEIASPLSNIIEETNAPFTIRGTLKQQHRLP